MPEDEKPWVKVAFWVGAGESLTVRGRLLEEDKRHLKVETDTGDVVWVAVKSCRFIVYERVDDAPETEGRSS